jgi:hypothetical protein
MNPFILSARDRLDHWKQFRKELLALQEKEQTERVARYWALAPLSRIAYDVERPDTWMTPWEMVSAGDWCRNSVAIGMEFTLRLAGWHPDRLQLENIKDYDLCDQMMVLIIDGQRVMNYTYAEVVDYPIAKHDVVGRWRFSGKFYVPVA